MNRPALLTLLVAGLVLTAVLPSTAARVRTPGGSAASSSGEISSAGDPWLPDRGKPGSIAPKFETYSMSCQIGDGKFKNGASIIKLVNTGSKPIPAGAIVEVTLPDGTTKKFKTNSEIQPGGSVGIMGPVGATAENYPCSASASRQVPANLPGSPEVSNGPVAPPSLPPKLTCTFEVIDGKVVVFWKNEGGTAIPDGALITGKTSGGIGVSSYLSDPIEPGETISIILDIDPSFFNEACVATIKY